MFKSQSLLSILLATTLITVFLATFPIQATTTQNLELLKTKNQNKSLTLSWSSIANIFSRKKSKKGSRGEICPIAPKQLIDQSSSDDSEEEIQQVWSDRPLFFWQIKKGIAQKIELFIPGDKQAIWQREIKLGETNIIYDGEPLQPGQLYQWRLTAKAPFTKERSVNFQVMEQQQRDRITAELAQLEAQLKQKAASVEVIALEKANYFVEKELWSDALRELYSVPTPSAELTQAVAQIQKNDFCPR
ncbi:MAG TPA: DUF928 domain-containing protein [Oculatellaceae cyanobacterium]|jgi:HPt (histidine-containing phosphotransfer) domain-containing protein